MNESYLSASQLPEPEPLLTGPEQFRLLSVVLRLESYDVRDVLRVLFSSRALGLAAGRAAGMALVELLIPQVV